MLVSMCGYCVSGRGKLDMDSSVGYNLFSAFEAALQDDFFKFFSSFDGFHDRMQAINHVLGLLFPFGEGFEFLSMAR